MVWDLFGNGFGLERAGVSEDDGLWAGGHRVGGRQGSSSRRHAYKLGAFLGFRANFFGSVFVGPALLKLVIPCLHWARGSKMLARSSYSY